MAVRNANTRTEYITEPRRFFELLANDQNEVENINIISPKMLQVSYKELNKEPGSFQNVILGGFLDFICILFESLSVMYCFKQL